MLRLGTAKKTITPRHPVRLAGYATRNREYDSVLQDIYTRVYLIEEGKKQLLIVYGDLIWWNPEFLMEARSKLSSMLGIPKKSILFVASHNHSGPGTGNAFTEMLETADDDYQQYLYTQIETAATVARNNLEPVKMLLSCGHSNLNVYRRLRIDKKIVMAPNYSVPADNNLTIVRFLRHNGREKGMLIHYACHANLSSGNDLHPDYPGIAMEILEKAYPECTSLFLQGCTGDLRPNSVLGERFITQDYNGVQQFASQFAQCCIQTIKDSAVGLEEKIQISQKADYLPVDSRDNKDRITHAMSGDILYRQWYTACQKKSFRAFERLELTLVKLGGLNMYFINGEPVQHYSKFARRIKPTSIVTGYTNGMIGYLPDREQIINGGYESNESTIYFAVAGTFRECIQEKIETMLKNM